MTSYEFPPVGGGGGQVVKMLARKLASLGDEVDLVTMGCAGLPAIERFPRMTVHRVPGRRRNLHSCTVAEVAGYLARAIPAVANLARSRRYDLVHSHFIFPDGPLGLYASRIAKAPLVLTAHGTDVPGHNPHRARLLHALLKPIWRVVTSGASRIVCPSRHLESLVKAANPHAAVTLIPNGLDPERFDPGVPKKDRILVVARMVESKGVHYLLQALMGFRPEYEVVLVGEGPASDDLKALAEELRVPATFTGWLENDSAELKRLFETSRIFAFPSLVENCPITLLEAMAAGCAVVTTRDTGCAEVVGETALLVPPRDPAAIRLALEQLAAERGLAETLGAAARARVVRHYSWENVAERYREVYRAHERTA